MAKIHTIYAIIAITLLTVVAGAEPPRFRQTRRRFGALRVQNNRKFARQEAAPSDAPYPAAGVTPEIPFDLPTKPDQTYGPPDQTYGPPPQPTPDQTYGPPEPTKPDQTYGPPDMEPAVTEPDSTYGPPEDEQPAIDEAEAETVQPADAELVSQNIIQPRQKLRLLSRSSPLRLRTAQPRGTYVEIIRSEPVLVYTLD